GVNRIVGRRREVASEIELHRRLAVAEDVVRGADAWRNVPIAVHPLRPLDRDRRGVEGRGGLCAVAFGGAEARRLIVADRSLHAETITCPGVLCVKSIGNRTIGCLPLR